VIGEYPLYSKPGMTVCTSEYIALYMGDRKVISMLICDTKAQTNEEIEARIKNLERKKLNPNKSEFLKKLLDRGVECCLLDRLQ